MPQDGCCVPEAEMVIIRDLNLAAPYKGGNQYARICPDCGVRKFCTKRYWQTSDVRHVIPNGESDPVRVYECPYPECDDDIHEGIEECEGCGGELEWVDEGEEEEADEDDEASDETETDSSAEEEAEEVA